ncbi:ABC transporter substrate-binding protein [Tychonema bourrellyi FEM_GT703]|uniref:ABC transporter substrate-binding protein n=1 Tax=Tychonema bourrellyi FEM_GT703 TaxID=2040638 RepID=A0A2G4F673_9CYAN|nr:ABC transporter substrate-binding protein [Tychonema bourrellyi]PHX57225.1 ABC transporter substrate-binding protein [Tychonema bourrellyi FEM_GT703]
MIRKIKPIALEIFTRYNQIASPKKSGLIAIILSVCLLIFAGCQSAINKNDGVIHLTLWQGINPPVNRDVFQKLVAEFNQKNHDIQVESIFVGQQLPKILTSVVGNSPPDILYFYPQVTGQFVNLDAIVPLEDWLDKLPLKSELYPQVLDEVKLNGHTWSVPMSTSPIGIFYRPKLFKEAGITELPKTWKELREVAKKLTIDSNADGKPEQYGMLIPFGKGEWTVFTWFPFLLSANGEIVQNNRPNLMNPGAIRAVQFWQDLLKDGSATLSMPERGYEEGDFISGRVAMQITGPWTYIMKSNVDYGVFPVPVDVRPATVVGTGTLFVMKTTPERQKAALKFLEYVLSKEFQTKWSIGTGFLPINMKSAKSQAYQEFLKQKPVLNVFIEQLSVAGSRPIIAGYSRISENLGRAIEASMLGQPVEKSLQEAQDRLELIWEEK